MSLDQLLAWLPSGSPEEALARQVNFEQLPAHVAIIMDGNGRWAAKRHLPRVEGHRAGINSVRDVVETSARLGFDVLTIYAFSVENWKRPEAEVSTLMALLKRYLRLELGTLLKNNIRFRVIGRPQELATDIQDELADAVERTSRNTGLLFNIALNYGGAQLSDAGALIARRRRNELDEKQFSDFLYRRAGRRNSTWHRARASGCRGSRDPTPPRSGGCTRRADSYQLGHPRVSEARSPLRRPQPLARRDGQVTRVLSGVVLLVVVGSISWLAPPERIVALAALVRRPRILRGGDAVRSARRPDSAAARRGTHAGRDGERGVARQAARAGARRRHRDRRGRRRCCRRP
jgi:undecaprenyl diphosphate synthase